MKQEFTRIAVKVGSNVSVSYTHLVEFYNKRGGKERIFDDMNNGFGWNRRPKSFMSENTVFPVSYTHLAGSESGTLRAKIFIGYINSLM